MDSPTTSYAAMRKLLCLTASILGLVGLAFAVAPGTVLASTGGVYAEEEVPPTPPKKENNGRNNGNNTGNGNNANQGNETGNSGYSGSGSSGESGDSGSEPPVSQGDSSSGKKSKKYSSGKYNPATDSKKNKASDDQNDDESVVAAAPASGDGGGGSAWPLIIAIVIGVPLIAGGGYLMWQRFRGPDDETRDKLKSAIGSKTADGPVSKSS